MCEIHGSSLFARHCWAAGRLREAASTSCGRLSVARRGDAKPRANSHAAAPQRLMRRRGLPIQMPPLRPALSQEGSTSAQVVIPSVIDLLANSKIRLDCVKRMTQIQNTSRSFAAPEYFRVAAREHTLAPPGRHRPRHSRMTLTARQNTPAIDSAISHPNKTLRQLQPSFHTQSTEPEPTARARKAGEEFGAGRRAGAAADGGRLVRPECVVGQNYI